MTPSIGHQLLSTRLARLGVSGDWEPLGEGGAGRLYRVKAEGRWRALKVAFDDERQTASFNRIRREAEILKRIDSHRIPRLVIADAGGEFLIRDYVDGRPLNTVGGRDARNCVREVLRTAGHLLPFVHGQRFAIRDFKPANLVVHSNGTVHLVDVGSCRRWEEIPGGGDTLRLGSNKWRHWAPEQLYGCVTAPAGEGDYFAVGATVAWCLVGDFPFSNAERVPADARDRYRTEWALTVPGVRRRLQDIQAPASVAEFVVSCLDPDPLRRPTEVPPW